MRPLREALGQRIEITKLRKLYMLPVNIQDFENSLQEVRPVSLNKMSTYEAWKDYSGAYRLSHLINKCTWNKNEQAKYWLPDTKKPYFREQQCTRIYLPRYV
ncbi:hypothetical protein OPV22_031392 [Ensete ventricosum]|uniref:Uncharacterized protein n=1 Tax=Ensete ventricosum TaxID=4639 RepID=A0AAV8P152_ENSVE|nr:hypothetical protein OPV22_031392 [Ensete ventricosum]